MRTQWMLLPAALLVAGLTGCNGANAVPKPSSAKTASAPSTSKTAAAEAPANDEVAAERAKLSPEDRKLVEAQEWCVISSDEKLGSMGAPIKLDIKGQAVFVCCGGCKKRALADPDATLAKVEELKKKKAAGGA